MTTHAAHHKASHKAAVHKHHVIKPAKPAGSRKPHKPHSTTTHHKKHK